uniref:Uncharacterized protein n=1 Tax=Triticum urartu TaxID=4572 RepID=A0A8R7TPB6_TRIUA
MEEQMLKRGFAWYSKFMTIYLNLVQWREEARAACQGLWLSYNPKKPWVWKRDHPRNAGKQDIVETDNEICEALSRMIEEEKNAEGKAREWKRELDGVVAENCMLNGQLQKSNEAL